MQIIAAANHIKGKLTNAGSGDIERTSSATAGQYETGILTNAPCTVQFLPQMKAPRGIIGEAHEAGITIGRSERDASIKDCTVLSRFLRLITLARRIPGQGSWEEGGQRVH